MTARRRLLRTAIGLTAAVAIALPLPAVASSPASPGSAASSGSSTQAAASVRLSVMTQNMFYGGDDYDLTTGGFCAVADGCPQALHRIADAIVKAKADVVGLQETERNTTVLANLLGWYSSPRAHVISRYPIIEPPGSGGMYVFVVPAPGRVVAVADFHLPSDPYGPYAVRDGASRAKVLKLERGLRVPAVQEVLPTLAKLVAQGYPVLVTGDFNSPSYLDWTSAVAKARKDVPYPVRWPASAAFAAAGFGDSYRDAHPDPVATPGFTWTPGGPEEDPHEVFDRIDWVLHAGPVTTLDSKVVGEAGGADVGVPVAAPYPSDHRGVVSTFQVKPVEPAPFAATQQRKIIQGDTISVDWQLAGGPAQQQRVGLVRHTSAGDEWVRSAAPGVAFGSRSFTIGNLPPGAYDVVLADRGGARILTRDQVYVYRPSDRPVLKTSRDVFKVGQRIGVSWTEAPGTGLDWIGLFPCKQNGKCGDNSTYLLYAYTHTDIEGSLTIGKERGGFEDTSAAWPLPPGRYVARLLVDDSYQSVGESNQFTITR
jgi:endonuclease/exonuclease/phosphatase family metal-dependent hydrolase